MFGRNELDIFRYRQKQCNSVHKNTSAARPPTSLFYFFIRPFWYCHIFPTTGAGAHRTVLPLTLTGSLPKMLQALVMAVVVMGQFVIMLLLSLGSQIIPRRVLRPWLKNLFLGKPLVILPYRLYPDGVTMSSSEFMRSMHAHLCRTSLVHRGCAPQFFFPTVIGIRYFFEFVHQEYVGYPLWDVPDLHSSVFSLLVGLQIPRIAVDLDSTSHSMNVHQVFLALEHGHR